MRIKQSLCIPMYGIEGKTFAEQCVAFSQIGFKAIEFWQKPENMIEFVRIAHENNLVVASMGGHDSLPDGMNKADNYGRIIHELEANIDFAVEHEIPGLICFSGNHIEGQDDQVGLENTVRVFKGIASYAEKKGINLNLELLNSKIDHPGYQADRSWWGVEVCRRVSSKRVKLLYDIYHMQIMEGDIIRTLTKNIEYIGHFHTAGNPGRLDFDDTQELNYEGICAAIARTDYPYYLGHEFNPKLGVLESLQRAFKICNQGKD